MPIFSDGMSIKRLITNETISVYESDDDNKSVKSSDSVKSHEHLIPVKEYDQTNGEAIMKAHRIDLAIKSVEPRLKTATIEAHQAIYPVSKRRLAEKKLYGDALEILKDLKKNLKTWSKDIKILKWDEIKKFACENGKNTEKYKIVANALIEQKYEVSREEYHYDKANPEAIMKSYRLNRALRSVQDSVSSIHSRYERALLCEQNQSYLKKLQEGRIKLLEKFQNAGEEAISKLWDEAVESAQDYWNFKDLQEEFQKRSGGETKKGCDNILKAISHKPYFAKLQNSGLIEYLQKLPEIELNTRWNMMVGVVEQMKHISHVNATVVRAIAKHLEKKCYSGAVFHSDEDISINLQEPAVGASSATVEGTLDNHDAVPSIKLPNGEILTLSKIDPDTVTNNVINEVLESDKNRLEKTKRKMQESFRQKIVYRKNEKLYISAIEKIGALINLNEHESKQQWKSIKNAVEGSKQGWNFIGNIIKTDVMKTEGDEVYVSTIIANALMEQEYAVPREEYHKANPQAIMRPYNLDRLLSGVMDELKSTYIDKSMHGKMQEIYNRTAKILDDFHDIVEDFDKCVQAYKESKNLDDQTKNEMQCQIRNKQAIIKDKWDEIGKIAQRNGDEAEAHALAANALKREADQWKIEERRRQIDEFKRDTHNKLSQLPDEDSKKFNQRLGELSTNQDTIVKGWRELRAMFFDPKEFVEWTRRGEIYAQYRTGQIGEGDVQPDLLKEIAKHRFQNASRNVTSTKDGFADEFTRAMEDQIFFKKEYLGGYRDVLGKPIEWETLGLNPEGLTGEMANWQVLGLDADKCSEQHKVNAMQQEWEALGLGSVQLSDEEWEALGFDSNELSKYKDRKIEENKSKMLACDCRQFGFENGVRSVLSEQSLDLENLDDLYRRAGKINDDFGNISATLKTLFPTLYELLEKDDEDQEEILVENYGNEEQIKQKKQQKDLVRDCKDLKKGIGELREVPEYFAGTQENMHKGQLKSQLDELEKILEAVVNNPIFVNQIQVTSLLRYNRQLSKIEIWEHQLKNVSDDDQVQPYTIDNGDHAENIPVNDPSTLRTMVWRQKPPSQDN